jgi:hypothetical protein
MRKKHYRIGTALTRKYRKTMKKTATMRAVKNTGRRIKKRWLTLINKTKQSVKRVTSKVDHTVAKKISSITKRRR